MEPDLNYVNPFVLQDVARSNKKLIKAFEDILVPALRAQGFEGKFPVFHRIVGDRVDLINYGLRRDQQSFEFYMGQTLKEYWTGFCALEVCDLHRRFLIGDRTYPINKKNYHESAQLVVDSMPLSEIFGGTFQKTFKEL